MSNCCKHTGFLIALSTLNLVVSGTTVAVVFIGAKKLEAEVEEVRAKANKTVQNVRAALENLEL